MVSWINQVPGLPALVLTLTGLRVAIAALAVTDLLAAAVVVTGHHPPSPHGGLVYEFLWAFLLVFPFLIAVRVIMRTVQQLDRTRLAAVEASADSASAIARNAERARFDALIHDSVISTLLAAEPGPIDPRLAAQAREALDDLDRLAVVDTDDRPVSATETYGRIRAVVGLVDPAAPVGVDPDPDFDPGIARYPAGAVRAISQAVGEAIRNAVLHAGPGAQRLILVEPAEDRLVVTVADDGVGFDPDAVAPERLGIEGSIRGRMAAVDGGTAEVVSRPGAGTTVRLSWSEPS